jgi:hypothetical protein
MAISVSEKVDEKKLFWHVHGRDKAESVIGLTITTNSALHSSPHLDQGLQSTPTTRTHAHPTPI